MGKILTVKFRIATLVTTDRFTYIYIENYTLLNIYAQELKDIKRETDNLRSVHSC